MYVKESVALQLHGNDGNVLSSMPSRGPSTESDDRHGTLRNTPELSLNLVPLPVQLQDSVRVDILVTAKIENASNDLALSFESTEKDYLVSSEPEMTVLPKATNMDEENKVNGNVPEQTNQQSPHQGSPNRAIYEFKHPDTDVEESPRLERKAVRSLSKNSFNAISEKVDSGSPEVVTKRRDDSTINLNLSNIRTRSRKTWPQQQDQSEDYDSEALQELIDSSILDPDWLKGGSDGLDNGSLDDGASDEQPALEIMDTGSEGDQVHNQPTKLNSSIHQLVSGAEHLVQATPLPSPIVSPRVPLFDLGPRSHNATKSLAPLHFGHPSECASKQMRIQSWLETQNPAPALLDSCDASGEMTTGESEGESSESGDVTHTTQIGKDLHPSSVSTPVNDRCGQRTFASEQFRVSTSE